MSRCCASLILGTSLLACHAPPEPLVRADVRGEQKIACLRTQQKSVTAVLCDFRAHPKDYDRFIGGYLAPPREAKLRHRSKLRFGRNNDVPVLELELKQLRASGSYFDIFEDPSAERDVAGWELLDQSQHLALLLIGVDRHLGLIVTEYPTSSASNVTDYFRALRLDQSFDELAQQLGGTRFWM